MLLQLQNSFNSILNEISKLRQSHDALEARVISMQRDINRLEELQGEPLFVSSRHLWENKKERTIQKQAWGLRQDTF